MKKFVNKLKQMDRTKKIVVLFITISFVFIIGFGCYHSLFDTNVDSKQEIANTNSIEDIKENDLEDVTDDSNNISEKQQSDVEVDDTKQNETTSQTTKTNENTSEKKQTSKTTDTTTSKNTSQKNTSQFQTTDSSNSHKNETNSSENNNKTEANQDTKEDNNISVNVQVIGVKKMMMSGTVNVENQASVYDALVKLAKQNGKTVSGSSSYVTGIGGLYEKDYGPLSGWMYKVNGVVPNKSAGSYKLSDGDNVVWYYVNYE